MVLISPPNPTAEGSRAGKKRERDRESKQLGRSHLHQSYCQTGNGFMQSQNRFCRYPSTGCSGAAASSVMDAIVPPPGLAGGKGRGGLWVSPELPAGGGCCCPRLPLPPRAPLRTGPGRGSAESGPVHPGGSGPIPPPAAEGGGKGAGDGGDAWERGAHHWAGGRGGKECKGVSPLLPICAPIACVQEGTSLLRGTRFGTAACPISCRSLSMPLLADKPPRAMAAVAFCL